MEEDAQGKLLPRCADVTIEDVPGEVLCMVAAWLRPRHIAAMTCTCAYFCKALQVSCVCV